MTIKTSLCNVETHMNTLTICLIGGTHIRALSDSLAEDPDLLRGETPNGKRFAVPARNILIIVEDEEWH